MLVEECKELFAENQKDRADLSVIFGQWVQSAIR